MRGWLGLMLVAALGFAGSASAADYCSGLKTALVAAKSGFSSITGKQDDLLDEWHDATLTLPYATDCHVENQKGARDYFCIWQKEQSAAIYARYKDLVAQTDRCLPNFRKTADDVLATYRSPAGEVVTIDAKRANVVGSTSHLMVTVSLGALADRVTQPHAATRATAPAPAPAPARAPAQAGMLPASSPDQLAAALQAHGLKPGSGFRPNGPMQCKSGAGGANYLYRCTAAMIDSARNNRTAAVEIMIFRSYDVAQIEAPLKRSIDAAGSKFKVHMSNKLDTDAGGGRTYAPRFSCYQARGEPNGLAYCLMAASSNVAIFTQVAPLRPGVKTLDTNIADEDMDHAAMLAGNGIEAILSAANLTGPARPAAAPPAPAPAAAPTKKGCTIWQVC